MRNKKIFVLTSLLIATLFFCFNIALAMPATKEATTEQPPKSIEQPSSVPIANQSALELHCRSAILLDGINGTMLYEQNADQRCYPASVTKIMTLVLILEALDAETISLEDLVSVSEAAAGMGGSQVYLYPGEQRSVHDMLIAIAVGSGNDAAYAMAEFVGGSYDAFIEMMNIRAAELAMSDTHFVNPHGLHDPNHYTTARDLSKLAFHALSVPHFLEYTSIYEYEFRPAPNLLTLWNTNRLLKWYAGTDGMKTGYTEEAGRNLVTTATRDGLRLISVVLGCEERRGHFSESMNLLNYGFNTFQYTSIYQQGQIIAQAAVAKGREDMVDLVASRDIGYISAKKDTAEISSRLEIPAWLSAPIKSGDIGGKLIVYKNGDLLCESELLAATAVDKSGLLRFWGKMLQIMGFN